MVFMAEVGVGQWVRPSTGALLLELAEPPQDPSCAMALHEAFCPEHGAVPSHHFSMT